MAQPVREELRKILAATLGGWLRRKIKAVRIQRRKKKENEGNKATLIASLPRKFCIATPRTALPLFSVGARTCVGSYPLSALPGPCRLERVISPEEGALVPHIASERASTNCDIRCSSLAFGYPVRHENAIRLFFPLTKKNFADEKRATFLSSVDIGKACFSSLPLIDWLSLGMVSYHCRPLPYGTRLRFVPQFPLSGASLPIRRLLLFLLSSVGFPLFCVLLLSHSLLFSSSRVPAGVVVSPLFRLAPAFLFLVSRGPGSVTGTSFSRIAMRLQSLVSERIRQRRPSPVKTWQGLV